MVQSKLDCSQVWYFEIQEKSHSRSELLQQALCNAKIFGEDEVELMNWLNEVHDKLSKLSVQDHSTEALWKQQSELRVSSFIYFIFFFSFQLLLIYSFLFIVFISCPLWFIRLTIDILLRVQGAFNDTLLNSTI